MSGNNLRRRVLPPSRPESLHLSHDFEDSGLTMARAPSPTSVPGDARGWRPLGHHDVRQVAATTSDITGCPLEESNLPQPVKSRLLYR